MAKKSSTKKTYTNASGYKMQYAPKSPSANNNGFAPTHRVVAEKKVDGAIGKNRVVHHRDGVKSNNSPANLQVMSRSAHSKLHATKQISSARTSRSGTTKTRRK